MMTFWLVIRLKRLNMKFYLWSMLGFSDYRLENRFMGIIGFLKERKDTFYLLFKLRDLFEP